MAGAAKEAREQVQLPRHWFPGTLMLATIGWAVLVPVPCSCHFLQAIATAATVACSKKKQVPFASLA